MPRLREGDTFSTGGKSWKSSEWWRSFCGELLWSFWEMGDDNNVDWKNCTDMGGVEWLWEAESLKLTVRITGTPLIPHTRYQKLALGDLVQLHLVQHHHQSQGSLPWLLRTYAEIGRCTTRCLCWNCYTTTKKPPTDSSPLPK